MILIKNGTLYDAVIPEAQRADILVGDDGKITAIGELPEVPGAEVIDATGLNIYPGFVEAHCHLGMHGYGIGFEGNDTNEMTDILTPQLRAIDGLNPMDPSVEHALKAGVTTVCTGPGSANVLGGQFAIIKTAGRRVDDMLVDPYAAMKCAFGENPKRCYGQNGKKAPMTRMGTASLLRELLFKTQRYIQDKEAGKNPGFDMKLEAMIPVLKGEIPLKAHAHRADDIFTSIRIAKEFGVKITLDHCTDGALIADELAKEGLWSFVGPSLGGKTKIELINKSFHTPAALHEAGVKVCIITDAPVIPLQNLPLCAGLAARSGLDMEEAWKAITINPATALGIADRVGSLEVGKDADIVIWTDDPLTTIGGEAWMTIVDGKPVYQA